jgi:hypothetical protein
MKPFPILISVLALSLSASVDAIEHPAAPLRETVPGLRIETQAYPDQAATEWQFRLRAPEAGESPLYENLKSADFEVGFPPDAKVRLHWNKGSHSEPGDFEPKTNPLVVGEALGYFAAEGVEVNLLPSDTSIPYVAFVQNGQADLAMLDPVETINAVNAGAGINTVFEVMQNAPEGIGIPESSTAKTVADLVGTTVGLVSDRDRAFLQAAFDTVGASIDDVQTVVLGESGPTLAAALRDGTGRVDMGIVRKMGSGRVFRFKINKSGSLRNDPLRADTKPFARSGPG